MSWENSSTYFTFELLYHGFLPQLNSREFFPCPACALGVQSLSQQPLGHCCQTDSVPYTFALTCVPLCVSSSVRDSGFQERGSGWPPMARLDFTHCYSEVQKQCNFSVSADLIWLSSFHSPNFRACFSLFWFTVLCFAQTFDISKYSPLPCLSPFSLHLDRRGQWVSVVVQMLFPALCWS